MRPTTRRCPRCRFPEAFCLCPEVPALRTRLRFVIVRHAAERERLSNTARWGALAIPGTELIEHGLPVTPVEHPVLATPGAVLLFPGATPSPTATATPTATTTATATATATPTTTATPTPTPTTTTTATPTPTAHPTDVPPALVVVPDGTWAQARRMVQRLAPLRAMPRLTLPEPPPALRLRRPPDGGMSTLEAMAGALARFGERDAADRLLALHAVGVERILRLKGTWEAGCGERAAPERDAG